MEITSDTDILTVKKILKSMGYKMKTKGFSWGRNVIYHHIESGQDRTGNVYTKETIEKWLPLNRWLTANQENLLVIARKNCLYGMLEGATK